MCCSLFLFSCRWPICRFLSLSCICNVWHTTPRISFYLFALFYGSKFICLRRFLSLTIYLNGCHWLSSVTWVPLEQPAVFSFFLQHQIYTHASCICNMQLLLFKCHKPKLYTNGFVTETKRRLLLSYEFLHCSRRFLVNRFLFLKSDCS